MALRGYLDCCSTGGGYRVYLPGLLYVIDYPGSIRGPLGRALVEWGWRVSDIPAIAAARIKYPDIKIVGHVNSMEHYIGPRVVARASVVPMWFTRTTADFANTLCCKFHFPDVLVPVGIIPVKEYIVFPRRP
jgi:hypothetical protein